MRTAIFHSPRNTFRYQRIVRALAGAWMVASLSSLLHSAELSMWFPTNAPRRFLAHAKALEDMNESPLYSHRPELDRESVRLLLLRTFKGRIAIHITKRQG